MKEWYTAEEIAVLALPGLPTRAEAVEVLALAQRWWLRRNAACAPLVRWRDGKPGNWEFHRSLFPEESLEELARRAAAEHPRVDHELWAWFEALPAARRRKAQERLEALARVDALHEAGMSKRAAVAKVAAENGIGHTAIYDWYVRLDGVASGDRLPALAGRHKGCTKAADCDDAAWAFFKTLYLASDAPSINACYERLRSEAAARGWTIPSSQTLRRRLLRDIPIEERQAARGVKGATRTLF